MKRLISHKIKCNMEIITLNIYLYYLPTFISFVSDNSESVTCAVVRLMHPVTKDKSQ